MRPRECSDEDIRRASEIVIRISLLTTSHIRNVDRTAFPRSRILEVDIRTDEERIAFQNRVTSIRFESNPIAIGRPQRFSIDAPKQIFPTNVDSKDQRLKKSA